MKKILLIICFVLTSASNVYGKNFRITEFSNVDELESSQSYLNTILLSLKDDNFNTSEKDIIRYIVDASHSHSASQSLNNKLLAVASFVVERNIETFSHESLGDKGDISSLIGAEILRYENESKQKKRFKSKMGVSFASFHSENQLVILNQEELGAGLYPDISDLVETLSPATLPDFVTYQESDEFTDYLNHSQVLTFYYNVSSGDQKFTYIKCYTVSDLRSDMNFFERIAMKKIIKNNLQKIPYQTELNGKKW